MKRLKAIDLCCGAGGWDCAARGLPIDIVLAIDFWEPACMTARAILQAMATRHFAKPVRRKQLV